MLQGKLPLSCCSVGTQTCVEGWTEVCCFLIFIFWGDKPFKWNRIFLQINECMCHTYCLGNCILKSLNFSEQNLLTNLSLVTTRFMFQELCRLQLWVSYQGNRLCELNLRLWSKILAYLGNFRVGPWFSVVNYKVGSLLTRVDHYNAVDLTSSAPA